MSAVLTRTRYKYAKRSILVRNMAIDIRGEFVNDIELDKYEKELIGINNIKIMRCIFL